MPRSGLGSGVSLVLWFVAHWHWLAAAALAADSNLRDEGTSSQGISATEFLPDQEFVFSHRIENIGAGPSDEITVRYYLTTDMVIDGNGETALKTYGFDSLAAGASFRTNSALQVPASLPAGTFYLGWLIETANESDTRDNSGYHPTPLSAAPPPPVFDLRDQGFSFQGLSSNTLDPGELFTLSARICNDGPNDSTGFSVQYRLSDDATIGDADDIVLGSETLSPITVPLRPPGCVAISEQLVLPANVSSGFYRIGYKILSPHDSDQSNNNVVFANGITVPPAPGSVDLYDAGPVFHHLPNIYPTQGSFFEFRTGIFNSGTNTSSSFNLLFHASVDGTLGNADDVFLGLRTYSGVPPNTGGVYPIPFFATANLPTSNLVRDQPYHLAWQITGGSDAITSNNVTVMSSVFTPIQSSNLVLLGDWTVTGQLSDPGGCFVVSGSIQNAGPLPATPALSIVFTKQGDDFETARVFTARIGTISRRSNAALLWLGGDDPDAETGGVVFPEIGPGETWTPTFQIRGDSIRRSQGDIGQAFGGPPARMDPSRYEVEFELSGDDNPDGNSYQLYNEIEVFNGRDLPDLILENEALSRDIGQTLTITGRVTNTGAVTGSATNLRFDLGGITIGNATIQGGFGDGASRAFSAQATIPGGLADGSYLIRGIVDSNGAVAERDECNNRDAIAWFSVGSQADFTEGDPEARVQPDAIMAGTSGDCELEVTNIGVKDATQIPVRFFLKNSPAADIELGQAIVTGLAPGATWTVHKGLLVPPGTPTGRYPLGWEINPGELIPENDTANNTGLFDRKLYVGSKPNLRAGSIPFSIPQDQAAPGDTVFFTGSHRNSGSADAGTHLAWIVLSTSPIPSIDDLVLDETTVNVGGSPADSEFEVSRFITIPPDLPTGRYWLGYIIDPGNTVDETNEADNLSAIKLNLLPPPGERPVIFEFFKMGNDVTLLWSSRLNQHYRLYRSRDLSDWETYDDVIPGQEFSTRVEFGPAAAGLGEEGQFRIMEVPGP